MNKSTKLLRKILLWAKNVAKRSETVQKLLYDIGNVKEFSDIQLHEIMLNDSVRISTYLKGIQRCIKPGDVVVDLGTGTGVLAFFAARRNPGKLYAVDHSDIIKVAEEIGRRNGITDITYVQTNSREFSPEEKVDVVLHEQMGMEIFSENMISNLLDLKKRILKPSGVIVPARFELFVEPVVLKDEFRLPFIWEQRIEGIDYSFLRESELLNGLKADYYPYREMTGGSVDYFVCEPEIALRFDLNHMNDESDVPHKLSAEKAVVREGVIDGLCVYFRAIFDDDISFDTSPLKGRMHWPHLLLRTERAPVKAGDIVTTSVDMGDLARHNTWQSSIRISRA